MSEKPLKVHELDYVSPHIPTRHALWPSLIVIALAGFAVLGAFFAPLRGRGDDIFWYAALLILMIGMIIFAVGRDKRGLIICAVAFSIILAISILLPSFNRASD